MKGILVILDGLGDLQHRQLGDKTPLEVAETPNLDFFATRGEMGYMYPVRPGFVPESDEAIVSIFGNKQMDSTRGQLEARGTGLKLTRGDLALRVNGVGFHFGEGFLNSKVMRDDCENWNFKSFFNIFKGYFECFIVYFV